MIPHGINFVVLDKCVKMIRSEPKNEVNLKNLLSVLKHIKTPNKEEAKKLRELTVVIENSKDTNNELSKQIVSLANEKLKAYRPQKAVFSSDLLTEKILSFLGPRDLSSASIVNKKTARAGAIVKIERMNADKEVSLKEIGFKDFNKFKPFIEKYGKMIESLNLSEFEIDDLDLNFLVSNCPNLKHLNLRSDKITNSGFVELVNLKKIKNLQIQSNQIESIDFLKNTGIEELKIQSRTLSDVHALSSLPHLTKLSLIGRKISLPPTFTGLENLSVLVLISHNIKDLNFLKGCNHLQELTLVSNQIASEDLNALRETPHLTKLTLMGNSIAEVRPLSYLKNVQNLFLCGTRIVSLEPLKKMEALKDVALELGNSLEDLAPLAELRNLNSLKLDLEKRTIPLSLYPLSRIPDQIALFIKNYSGILVGGERIAELAVDFTEEGPFRSLEGKLNELKTSLIKARRLHEKELAHIEVMGKELATLKKAKKAGMKWIASVEEKKKRCGELQNELTALKELRQTNQEIGKYCISLRKQISDLKMQYQRSAGSEIHNELLQAVRKLKENESQFDRNNALLERGRALVVEYNSTVLVLKSFEEEIVKIASSTEKEASLHLSIAKGNQEIEKAEKLESYLHERIAKYEHVLKILLIP